MLQVIQNSFFGKLKVEDLKGTLPLLLLVGFILVFPKAGFKVGDVPITFGYLVLGVVAVFVLAFNIVSGRICRLSRTRWIAFGAMLPFSCIVTVTIHFNGYDGFGFLLSLFVSLVFVPTFFIFVLAPQLENVDLDRLLNMLRVGVYVVAVYGIFLFIYKFYTGSFIEVPYLTVNASDVGTLEDKYIDRGGVFKLISTYNNGNIYGVSLLILLPLYALVERSPYRLLIVKTSLLLTLSRTVWIGLLLHEILNRLYVSRVSLKNILGLVAGISLVLLGVFLSLWLIGVDASFLFDPNLGGRSHLLSETSASLYALKPFKDIKEIVYISVLNGFGLVGLFAFVFLMMSPLVLHFLQWTKHGRSAYKRSLALGMVLYLILAGSDGAILYIPVMAFYWFVASLLLSPQIPRVGYNLRQGT